MRSKIRSGFTLVELLVVIAIIGILASLLLPAVIQAREAARRMNCSSNIRQLALAVSEYEATFTLLPRAGQLDSDFSVQARLLPFLDQGPLFNTLRFDQPAFTGSFREKIPNPLFARSFSHIVPVLVCPSDGVSKTTTVATSVGSFRYGGLNYFASFGSGRDNNYDFRWPTDGAFFEPYAVDWAHFTDGMSNTVLFAESIRSEGADITLPAGRLPKKPITMTLNGSGGLDSGLQANQGMKSTGAPWSGYLGLNGLVANAPVEQFWTQFNGWRGGMSPALRGRGISWAFSGAINSMTNGYLPPNSDTPDIVTHWTGYFAPRSYHQGGVNVVLADASVHFLNDAIDKEIHRDLYSCNGGESQVDNGIR